MGRRMVYSYTGPRLDRRQRDIGQRIRRRLDAEYAGAARTLARSKLAAYLWVAFSVLSFLSVILGYGGIPNLVAGALTGLLGWYRLSQLAAEDHRADLESHAADAADLHKADVSWWLDRLHWSENAQERVAAHALLTYWGWTDHHVINPLHTPAQRLAACSARVEAKASQLDADHARAEAARQQRDQLADARLQRAAADRQLAPAKLEQLLDTSLLQLANGQKVRVVEVPTGSYQLTLTQKHAPEETTR